MKKGVSTTIMPQKKNNTIALKNKMGQKNAKTKHVSFYSRIVDFSAFCTEFLQVLSNHFRLNDGSLMQLTSATYSELWSVAE